MIRSIFLNIVLFFAMSVYVFCGIFFIPFSEDVVYEYWFRFSRMFRFIAKHIGGIDFKIENEQYLKTSGRVIFASRHESMWETIAFISLFPRPVFVMKKELHDIPLFGWLADKVHSIFVDREHGLKALIEVSRQISAALDDGRQVIIFPEGTRMPVGEFVPLKRGISLFYGKNNCSIIPIIHNSGKFWARRSFKKNPGTITVKIMEPIAPGLPSDEFMNRLNNIFQTEIAKLNEQDGVRRTETEKLNKSVKHHPTEIENSKEPISTYQVETDKTEKK